MTITDDLFSASPLLTALRSHTRQCLVPPWAVLGVILQRVAAAYPTATIDGEPLNAVFALVGGQESGKSTARDTALSTVMIGDNPSPLPPPTSQKAIVAEVGRGGHYWADLDDGAVGLSVSAAEGFRRAWAGQILADGARVQLTSHVRPSVSGQGRLTDLTTWWLAEGIDEPDLDREVDLPPIVVPRLDEAAVRALLSEVGGPTADIPAIRNGARVAALLALLHGGKLSGDEANRLAELVMLQSIKVRDHFGLRR